MDLVSAATLYFWIWEILALAFMLTNAYMIWRINVLNDAVNRLTRNEATKRTVKE